MKNLKILILLTYYERPNMVKNSLNSILNNNETYKNWELAFIDDGSIKRGRPVVEEILKDHLDKVKFYRLDDTIEEKIKRGGSLFGKCMNDAIKNSDAEIAFNLNDDDFLFDNYFFNLNNHFNNNPGEYYCCANWVQYFFSSNKVEIWDSYCKERNMVKGTMWSIAWKTECNRVGRIWFPYPLTISHDVPYMKDLYERYGKPKINSKGDFFHICKVQYQGNLSSIYSRGEDKIETYNDIRDIKIDMNYILKKQYINPILMS